MASVSGGYIAARIGMIVGLTVVMSALLWLITPKILEKINMIGQQLVATLCARCRYHTDTTVSRNGRMVR